MTTQTIIQSSANIPAVLKIVPSTPRYVGCLGNPFNITLITEDSSLHEVSLYAQHSNSSPYVLPKTKWYHLIPQWRFADINGNTITSITPSVTSYFTDIPGTTGMLASAQFYFIDDRQTENDTPIIIWAFADFSSLPVWYDNSESSGYVNSKVGIGVPVFVNGIVPNELKITSNGISEMFDYYWKSTNIPFSITVI